MRKRYTYQTGGEQEQSWMDLIGSYIPAIPEYYNKIVNYFDEPDNFSEAFSRARAEGKPTFVFDGKEYNTSLKKEIPASKQKATKSVAKKATSALFSPELFLRQGFMESRFKPSVVSGKETSRVGAMGLAQLMPSTIETYKKAHPDEEFDPYNPEHSVNAQKWFMNWLSERPYLNKPGQSVDVTRAKVLGAYNWGPGNMKTFLEGQKAKGVDIYNSLDWVENLDEEPRKYIQGILLNQLPSFQQEIERDTVNSPYNKLYGFKRSGGAVNPLAQLYNDNLYEAEDGVEYQGPSLVNYLATKGVKFDKESRRELAKLMGVENYDFSADKNLELLYRLRSNKEAFSNIPQAFNPYTVEELENYAAKTQTPVLNPQQEAIANAFRSEVIGNYFNYQNSINKGIADARTASLQRPVQAAPVEIPVSKSVFPDNALLNLYQQSIQKGIADSKKNSQVFNGNFGSESPKKSVQEPPIVAAYPSSQVDEALLTAYQNSIQRGLADAQQSSVSFNGDQGSWPIPAPAKPPAKRLVDVKSADVKNKAKELENNQDEISWYENALDRFTKAFNSNNISFSGTGFIPGQPEQTVRHAVLNTIGLVSDDAQKLFDNYLKRKDLKDNENLQETRTKFTIPKDYKPAIVAGDTIPIDKDRYVLPAMIDLNQTKWGVRNRGDFRPVNTEAADITAFTDFVPAGQYFQKNPADKETSTYIGVDADGNVKVGNKRDFLGTNYSISKTFGNKIVDFPLEADGKMKLKNSSPAASNKHLSPVIQVMGDDGKLQEGRMNLLIPKKSRDTNSFGQITGGRVIFKTPAGEQYLVSGSAEDIRKAFYSIKGNNPWVEAVTLDNGSYAMGYRTKKGIITEKELRDYQGGNTTGSVFLYLKPGDYLRGSEKKQFKDVQMSTPNIRTEKDESFKKGHSLTNAQKAIVLHHTGFSDTTGVSKGMSRAMRQVNEHFQKPGASSHVVIDFDGTRYNFAKPDQVTFHAGKSRLRDQDDVNDFGIGIEFQGDTSKKPLTDKQISSFVEYIAPIIKEKKIPLENIVTHTDIRQQYMNKYPDDRNVLGKIDVSEKDYSRILAELKKRRIYRKGGPIMSSRGQWDYPGQDTIVPTPDGRITMQGVPYPVYGQDETGYGQMMYPGAEYQFPGQMVYETPMMKSGGQHGGLDRWFAEKWVDIKTGKPCGRQEGENRSYPACRPSRRVSSETPKTRSEMSPSEKAKFKQTKTSSARIPYNHKRN